MLEQVGGSGGELILVFLEPGVGAVLYRSGVVFDAEFVIDSLCGTSREAGMFVAFGIEVSCEFLVSGLGNDALFVQQRQDASVFAIDQVEDVLIVGEGDKFPQDSLTLIFVLFQLEHIFVELLLQCLIGVIDANLLKIVDFKSLESEDIQHSDGCVLTLAHLRLLIGDAFVDLGDNVVKRRSIRGFHQSLTRFLTLSDIHGTVDHFVSGTNGTECQRGCQIFEGNAEKLGRRNRRWSFVKDACVTMSM
mmetsp:Transcript_22306/g.46370  ORF Transcript_22306/g.46370 Transcript_22306/m.46370 type:complete len:248 (+) Transcript_22306:3960-4703(+)